MIVTGIGSREIDPTLYKYCYDLALVFSRMGWTLRSGGARGADTAWESGFDGNENKIIYLPEPNFNGRPNGGCYYVPVYNHIWQEAENIARKIHPKFDALTEFGQNAHTRNVYQVLGDDLKTKSDLVIVCAEPKGKSVSGGTATAYNLAKALGITTYNLWNRKDRETLYELYAPELMGSEPLTGQVSLLD